MKIEEYRVATQNENELVRITELMKGGKKELESLAKEQNGIVVHLKDIPKQEYTYAWELDRKKKKIVINLSLVCNFMCNVFRNRRNQMLKDLDLASMRAIEEGEQEQLKHIVDAKKQLRDLPEKIEKHLQKIVNSKKRDSTKLKELENFKITDLQEYKK